MTVASLPSTLVALSVLENDADVLAWPLDQPQLHRLLPDLILVPAEEACGLGRRPAVGHFVRQVR